MAALASVAMQPKDAGKHRLAAPSDLTAREVDVWQRTVTALPAEWFKADQAPLLERYCRHVCRAQALEALIRDADPVVDLDRYSKLSRLAAEDSRLILALARSLRLTVQSRLHPATAASRAAAERSQPDISVLFNRESA